jgi:hypothetical protein
MRTKGADSIEGIVRSSFACAAEPDVREWRVLVIGPHAQRRLDVFTSIRGGVFTVAL